MRNHIPLLISAALCAFLLVTAGGLIVAWAKSDPSATPVSAQSPATPQVSRAAATPAATPTPTRTDRQKRDNQPSRGAAVTGALHNDDREDD